MLIIPAIDIREGNCVRLMQGDPEKETVYSSDPVEMALRFEHAGAQLIHVVDLDGAFQGTPVNRDIVAKIAKSVKVPIEIGGGIRNAETIRMYLDKGIRRIIVGTVLMEDSFKGIAEQYCDVIIAGVDAKNSMVATHGWKNVSTIKSLDIIKDIAGFGIREVIYTDISTDGMMNGPNIKAIQEILLLMKDMAVVASGGVSSLDDIKALKNMQGTPIKGCIIGKAIYDGRIDLAKAIARFGKV